MKVTDFLGLSLKRLAGRLLLKKKVVVPPLQIPQTVIEEMETETERRLDEAAENARLNAVLVRKIAEAQGDIDHERKWAAMMVYLPTQTGKMRTFSESQRLKMFHRHLAAIGGINECSFLAYHSLEYLCFFEDIKKLEFHRVVYIGEVVLAARRKIVQETDDDNEFRVWRCTEILNEQAHKFFDDDGLDDVLAQHLMHCFSSVGCDHMAVLENPPKDE